MLPLQHMIPAIWLTHGTLDRDGGDSADDNFKSTLSIENVWILTNFVQNMNLWGLIDDKA